MTYAPSSPALGAFDRADRSEDIGSLIDQSVDDLYLFSSDDPHVEGGKDPIGRFEGPLGSRSDAVRDNFHAENVLRIFPGARVH
jgi:hypothetical protein